ncbi:hypothetical protein PQO03_07805 [Lentisphaera profundi]|uniref:Uncharacterized protein n=1 Tax=Lentisphaera profundi TaxID=1658616 RepID=A0ABY7VQM9_9BACT|nr:hypothetical protein [Lentisphaera profundi]WDE95624.1 hypothetical protein PQO03_07805 [Lentisphaera profundi]
MIRVLFFLSLLASSYAADSTPLNNEDFLSVLNKKTLQIKKSTYSLYHKGQQIALACAFSEKGYLITSLKEFKENIMIQDERGGLYPIDLIGRDSKSHISVIQAPFKLSPPLSTR